MVLEVCFQLFSGSLPGEATRRGQCDTSNLALSDGLDPVPGKILCLFNLWGQVAMLDVIFGIFVCFGSCASSSGSIGLKLGECTLTTCLVLAETFRCAGKFTVARNRLVEFFMVDVIFVISFGAKESASGAAQEQPEAIRGHQGAGRVPGKRQEQPKRAQEHPRYNHHAAPYWRACFRIFGDRNDVSEPKSDP
jgi:hypothetical protein